MNDYEKLLQRWAELEPDKCTYAKDHWEVYGRFLWEDDDTNSDKIQGAVQEAIEARGWQWALPNQMSRDQEEELYVTGNRDRYRAVVFSTYKYFGNSRYRPTELGSSVSPAHTLLSAYIKALETVEAAP